MAIAATVLAIALPVLLSMGLAYREAQETEADHLLTFAHDVLGRSEVTADQIDAITAALHRFPSINPCSPERLAIMRKLDLASSYIQAIGYVSENRLICSSLNFGQEAFEIGPPDFIGPRGAIVRLNIEFPFAKGHSFVIVENKGYAAILHKDIAVNIPVDRTGLSLGTLSPPTNRILLSRGYADPAWFDSVLVGKDVTFQKNGYLIAIAYSRRHAIGSYAALPEGQIQARMFGLAGKMVPAGIVAGLILASLVFYLTRHQLAMPAVIRSALKGNEFSVVYQPIVDLQTLKWVGAEALIRWRRPGGVYVRPDLFIPVAEEFGLIRRITKRVLRLIAADMGSFFAKNPDFHIAVNVSATDLHSDDIVSLFQQFRIETGAGDGHVTVEATERSFMDPEAARQNVDRLRKAGIKVAIDDFGTGYSSLSYLEKFELDFLKIDRSFVETIGTEAATSKVVFHITEMAKSLNLDLIAEGVETETQMKVLREHGVRYAQGWYFARPMPFHELREKLQATNHNVTI